MYYDKLKRRVQLLVARRELERLKREGKQSVAVQFTDGMLKKLTFLEAVQLCAGDQTVTDAIMEDETGNSLFRAILDADHDFSGFGEFGE